MFKHWFILSVIYSVFIKMKNIVADFNMRRSSSFDGAGPLRVRNDAEPRSRSRSSVSGPRASFSGSRASFGQY